MIKASFSLNPNSVKGHGLSKLKGINETCAIRENLCGYMSEIKSGTD